MKTQGNQPIPKDPYKRTYEQYWNQTSEPYAVAKSIAIKGPGIDKTIPLGSQYYSWPAYWIFNATLDAGYSSHQEFQNVTLIHEYMHILNNMNHEQLVEKWEKEGAQFNEYWRNRGGLGPAIQDWIRGGCKKE
ncbi:MAG: hypothetical protein IPJ07_03880 [Acidobacteria bacterium]|nr:hypothetical protein [Acidobacteriota bacterium]